MEIQQEQRNRTEQYLIPRGQIFKKQVIIKTKIILRVEMVLMLQTLLMQLKGAVHLVLLDRVELKIEVEIFLPPKQLSLHPKIQILMLIEQLVIMLLVRKI